MINITNNITNQRDVPRLVKYEVVDVQDLDDASPPVLSARIRFYGPNAEPYMGDVTVFARDSEASVCLRANASQQSYSDLLQLYGASIPGLYSRLSDVWNANTADNSKGTKKKRLKAVEADLVPSGILDVAFAGA